jgi:LuxR family maltose regulon positive regulatory protein
LLHTVLVRAHLQAGDVDGAERSIDAATAHATGHRVLDEVRLPGLRSWVMFLRGDLTLAEDISNGAVGSADRLELPEQEVGRIFAGLATSCILAERNDLSAAEKPLELVATAADMGRRPPFQSLVALQQARLASAQMDEVLAAGHLKRAQLFLVSASPSMQATFALEAAQQAILFDPSKAHVIIDALDDGPDAVLLRAKLALREEDPVLASSLLDMIAPASSLRERVERAVLVALTLVDRDVDHANKHLGEALRLAHPQGFVRTIIAHGSAVPKLLASFPADEALEPYVQTLTEASNSQLAPLRRAVDTTIVEPLSERETTVLRYLASRLTNQEIATALYVSLNTMKSHLRNVYRKLGVTSRAEAVEAGRRLRII